MEVHLAARTLVRTVDQAQGQTAMARTLALEAIRVPRTKGKALA
jgi:hypothetical protein